MNSFPAGLEFSAAIRRLPESTGHRIADLAAACAYGYLDPLWPKHWAAKVALRANMEEAVNHGKGNKAARREAQEFAARMHEECNGPLTEHDLAVMEKRYFKRPALIPNEGPF